MKNFSKILVTTSVLAVLFCGSAMADEPQAPSAPAPLKLSQLQKIEKTLKESPRFLGRTLGYGTNIAGNLFVAPMAASGGLIQGLVDGRREGPSIAGYVGFGTGLFAGDLAEGTALNLLAPSLANPALVATLVGGATTSVLCSNPENSPVYCKNIANQPLNALPSIAQKTGQGVGENLHSFFFLRGKNAVHRQDDSVQASSNEIKAVPVNDIVIKSQSHMGKAF